MEIKNIFTSISRSFQEIDIVRSGLSPYDQETVDPLLAALISSNAIALGGPEADNITPEITLRELDVLFRLLPTETPLVVENEAGITFINLIPPK